jgi:integrase
VDQAARVTFHSLRHSAGSVMLARGVELVDVSAVLGHSSPLITARIYAHSFDAGKRHAIDSASAALLRKGA